jgi:hypothetical protein
VRRIRIPQQYRAASTGSVTSGGCKLLHKAELAHHPRRKRYLSNSTMRFLTLSALLAATHLALASNVLEASSKTFAATLGDTPSLVELCVPVKQSSRPLVVILIGPFLYALVMRRGGMWVSTSTTRIFLAERCIINTLNMLFDALTVGTARHGSPHPRCFNSGLIY